jgi:hypothetical protein
MRETEAFAEIRVFYARHPKTVSAAYRGGLLGTRFKGETALTPFYFAVL